MNIVIKCLCLLLRILAYLIIDLFDVTKDQADSVDISKLYMCTYTLHIM